MLTGLGDAPMVKEQILELMQLRGWSRMRLALELHVSLATVHSWIKDGAAPEGPPSLILRLWLREARGEIRIVEIAPPAGTLAAPAVQAQSVSA